jgi:hypothetical protein
MTSPASTFKHKPEFDSFLFATVGEDKRGMLLSVVSALARLNVDPWQEAAALTDLPKETATRRLASLIAKLPVEQSGKLDEGTIAARLIALLPSKRSPAPAAHEGDGGGAKRDPRIAMFVFFAMSMLVALSLSLQHQTPLRANHAPSTVASSVAPQSPTPARAAPTTDAQKTIK